MAYNTKNMAVRRLKRDFQELIRNPSPMYCAHPMEGNLFEWHFTIRGPPDTVFEGGIYHGRILLPPDFPYKPPNFEFLTPNGRFQTHTKVCLSISAHHPESWQPTWGIRLILEALIAFMPTPPEGAIGSLDFPDAERKRLAQASSEWRCKKCSIPPQQLLENRPNLPAPGQEAAAAASGGGSGSGSALADQLKQLRLSRAEGPQLVRSRSEIEGGAPTDQGAGAADDAQASRNGAAAGGGGEATTAAEAPPSRTSPVRPQQPADLPPPESAGPAARAAVAASAPASVQQPPPDGRPLPPAAPAPPAAPGAADPAVAREPEPAELPTPAPRAEAEAAPQAAMGPSSACSSCAVASERVLEVVMLALCACLLVLVARVWARAQMSSDRNQESLPATLMSVTEPFVTSAAGAAAAVVRNLADWLESLE